MEVRYVPLLSPPKSSEPLWLPPLVILGDAQVGKRSLCRACPFTSAYPTKVLSLDSFDPEQDLTNHGVLLVYSVKNRRSFVKLKQFLEKNPLAGLPKIIVANNQYMSLVRFLLTIRRCDASNDNLSLRQLCVSVILANRHLLPPDAVAILPQELRELLCIDIEKGNASRTRPLRPNKAQSYPSSLPTEIGQHRQVSRAEGQALARSLLCTDIEVSACTKENLEICFAGFSQIVKEYYTRRISYY